MPVRTYIVLRLVIAAALFSGAGSVCHAQYAGGAAGFDSSIRTLKYNAVGDFQYGVDDYVQYLPAAGVIGMKALIKAEGYHSRSSWGRMIVSDAFSVAAMAAAVNGIKYTVRRPRPDGSSRNSFPSGHTATSFMAAAMLHEEYGWRSPWFSFGGYAVASAVGLSRIINDRHWTSDVIAGAVIGMASVKFGYWLADLIFRDRYIDSDYSAPEFGFDAGRKYYDIGLYFGYRFFLGDNAIAPGAGGGKGILKNGGSSGLVFSVPLSVVGKAGGTVGVSARAGANSYCADSGVSFNTYDFMAGGYWRMPFARVLEAGAEVMAGYSLPGNRSVSGPAGILGGLTAAADCGLAVTTGENFKVKAFASYEVSRFTVQKPFVHSVVLGGSAAFFW